MAVVVAAVLYIAAGSLHFIKPEPYLRIMPPYIPWHSATVRVSGAFEILGGLGLFMQSGNLPHLGAQLFQQVFVGVEISTMARLNTSSFACGYLLRTTPACDAAVPEPPDAPFLSEDAS